MSRATGSYVFFYNSKQEQEWEEFGLSFNEFHNSCQMYIPNKSGLFRSTFRKIVVPEFNELEGEETYVQYIRFVQPQNAADVYDPGVTFGNI